MFSYILGLFLLPAQSIQTVFTNLSKMFRGRKNKAQVFYVFVSKPTFTVSPLLKVRPDVRSFSRTSLFYISYSEGPLYHVNRKSPDHSSHLVASDLGLHSLSNLTIWNARVDVDPAEKKSDCMMDQPSILDPSGFSLSLFLSLSFFF